MACKRLIHPHNQMKQEVVEDTQPRPPRMIQKQRATFLRKNESLN